MVGGRGARARARVAHLSRTSARARACTPCPPALPTPASPAIQPACLPACLFFVRVARRPCHSLPWCPPVGVRWRPVVCCGRLPVTRPPSARVTPACGVCARTPLPARCLPAYLPACVPACFCNHFLLLLFATHCGAAIAGVGPHARGEPRCALAHTILCPPHPHPHCLILAVVLPPCCLAPGLPCCAHALEASIDIDY